MHVLTILTTLRTEITQAECATTQAWDRYVQARSDHSFLQAMDATQQTITLHRQLAQRLEQLVGLPEATREDEAKSYSASGAVCGLRPQASAMSS